MLFEVANNITDNIFVPQHTEHPRLGLNGRQVLHSVPVGGGGLRWAMCGVILIHGRRPTRMCLGNYDEVSGKPDSQRGSFRVSFTTRSTLVLDRGGGSSGPAFKSLATR